MYANNFKDITGFKINKWTVIKRVEKTVRRCPYWLCICECGTEKIVSGNSLRNGSKSCGCSKRERPVRISDERRINKQMSNIRARYRCDAKKRKLSFDLTKDDFDRLIKEPCYYCGKIGSNKQNLKNNVTILYNGIDRVDNTKGYSIQNCVACCRHCNTIKKAITPDMIKKCYKFLFGDNDE